MLKGSDKKSSGAKASAAAAAAEAAETNSKQPGWNALRDDYMMQDAGKTAKASLRDFDAEDSSSSEVRHRRRLSLVLLSSFCRSAAEAHGKVAFLSLPPVEGGVRATKRDGM